MSFNITPVASGYQEIHPYSAMNIDSVKINTSLLMMRECSVSFTSVRRFYNCQCIRLFLSPDIRVNTLRFCFFQFGFTALFTGSCFQKQVSSFLAGPDSSISDFVTYYLTHILVLLKKTTMSNPVDL